MISRLLLPSAVRLATYSCLRRDRRIRARHIMCSARLAYRLRGHVTSELLRGHDAAPASGGRRATPRRPAHEALVRHIWLT
jgi:hypothetical protein